MKDNIYVQFLKYAESKGLDGFSEEEVIERFGERIKPVLLSAKKSQALVYNDVPGQNRRQVLSLEGMFMMLDHQELIEAKAAARDAKQQARLAFTLSILSLLVAGITTYLQLSTPVRVEPEQISEILESLNETAERGGQPVIFQLRP